MGLLLIHTYKVVIVGTLLNKDSHPIGSQPLELTQHRHSSMFLIGWSLFSLNQRNQRFTLLGVWVYQASWRLFYHPSPFPSLSCHFNKVLVHTYLLYTSLQTQYPPPSLPIPQPILTPDIGPQFSIHQARGKDYLLFETSPCPDCRSLFLHPSPFPPSSSLPHSSSKLKIPSSQPKILLLLKKYFRC